MLKVIINGCNGSMGQILSKCIEDLKEIEIAAGIDNNPEKCNNTYSVYKNIFDIKESADVLIDFSNPNCIPYILDYGLERKIPLVIATTGLSDRNLKDIKKASENIPIVHSANTSLGVNILVSLVKKAAVIINESFDIEIIEKHHNKKIDAPSGTAYLIADAINEELNNSMVYVNGRECNNEKRAKNEIGIHAIRGGTIPGEHSVIFAGMDEIIEIKHTALSKRIFALGAIKAAKYIVNQDKGLYTMTEVIDCL